MKNVMSKALIAVLCLMVSFLGYTTAQEKAATATATTLVALEKAQDNNTLLWKIEGDGIQTSYLYGTIHLIPQADFFIAEATKTAMLTSDQVVMELKMDDPNMQMAIMQNAAMKDGSTLDKLVSEEDYKKVDELLKSALGMGVAPFNGWQPMLTSSLFLSKFIDGTPASYEGSFVAMAKEANKELLGLETVLDQVNAMGEIPYQKQAELLMETVNDMEGMKKIFAKLVGVYKTQDIEALHEMIAEQSGGEEFAQFMIYKRNKNWIPKIGELAKDKTTFFAVGSGHLGGELGVVNLLKEAGYTVTPIAN
ncbi:MAG: TraB/GumN family protein [Saprospiraceae bacterium]|nr:TraB/GumN family protein [Saprospiraceae bacterium]